ncbi:MAG: sulfatase/phosphatase domain-containing protein, partial [Verrucomicrobiia bacterium]
YKLMNFYDLKEWELYDLSTDPKEMKNQYNNPEYTKTVARMHKELEKSRKRYDLPEIERQSLENVNMYYHSTEISKRQMKAN